MVCVCGGGGVTGPVSLLKDRKKLSSGYICSCGKCEVKHKYKAE